MPKQTKPKSPTPVESIKHKDSRKNIPTEELRDFVRDDEESPKKIFYPRDPSLDPQLVWKGKDEQDSHPLEVPALPIYIQEKIHPQALIENLRQTAKKGEPEPELQFFNDFNGIGFEDMIEFYQHDQHWQNRMILGDSLLVMNSLAEKEGLKGKVQMVYIDPPYGIKFGSNWQVSTMRRKLTEAKSEDISRQPEQVKAFRDTWENGVNSWLSYLRDRLILSRELLSESGSIFVQIGDENMHVVRNLLDEVFGPNNFQRVITALKTSTGSGDYLPAIADYIFWYSKDKGNAKAKMLYAEKIVGGAGGTALTHLRLADGSVRRISEDEISGLLPIPDGARVYGTGDLTSSKPPGTFPVVLNGKQYSPGHRFWSTGEEGMKRLLAAGRISAGKGGLSYTRYQDDFPLFPHNNVWTDTVGQNQFGGGKRYIVQTALRIVERCLLICTDPGDLVLDPTCGSGTTSIVAEKWGRRWITIDTSRVAIALARTWVMSAKHPYYLLSDSKAGYEKDMEIRGLVTEPRSSFEFDIHKDFVYRRVPHVMLESIANNDEIDVIVARYQEELRNAHNSLNIELKQNWEDWQIPREGDQTWSAKAKELHKKWLSLTRSRQREIDDSIPRRAETQLLYDQPYEDNKRIRVAGPFTVESLSPHRVLSTVENEHSIERSEDRDFVSLIIENLRRAGIQNTKKSERLKFDRLDVTSNPWIHASGEYTDADGKVRRVAISIGPEHGTVDPYQIKEAAKEAVKGIGYDSLYVLGFAFDPHTTEEAKRYGKLQVNITRMNPDLAMSDELLKKTGSGNLFMVFGEPDVDINKVADGKYQVEIKGVDVYDPTTGELRSNTTDDIACWFIDTNYNSESFFVRHAYFTGGQDPYEKLKRALKAEINEEAWESLYSTTSRPFDKPEKGKIAIKVINHYGDEVLKVFDV